MVIGALSAAWPDLTLDKVLDFFAGEGVQAIELGTGNWPGDSHCNPFELNADTNKREDLLDAVRDHGMVISALACHGNPLHPNNDKARASHEVFVATVELASSIGVNCVNGFSGLPGGAPGDKTPNWVVAPWPDDHLEALKYQWDTVAIPYWQEQNGLLAKHGVNMCFEMHPNFLVYNPKTLLKLRQACGDQMCCNFDPSHLWWQGIEPVDAVRWLSQHGEIIKHVHAKDCMIYLWNAKIHGVLDTEPYAQEAGRSWIFRTVGYGHDLGVWNDLISTLRMVAHYDRALSIEHEDSLMSRDEGFRRAVAMLKQSVIFEPPSKVTWA
ncbi:MAG: sugar phosphate isomerase/epimerase [Candidatus Berkelbacteria bacterium]|nr:sugar phosphate isomerase/epimerase [Candidatus Berkelbacteria bacterium]